MILIVSILFSNIMLPNKLETEVSRFMTHVKFIRATILVSFNFLSVMSLVSSYQRKTRIFIFTFLLLCPCNQSIEQSKRNSDGVKLPLRHMKYYKTSATILELIEGPTTDNRPMCLFIFFYFILFFFYARRRSRQLNI